MTGSTAGGVDGSGAATGGKPKGAVSALPGTACFLAVPPTLPLGPAAAPWPDACAASDVWGAGAAAAEGNGRTGAAGSMILPLGASAAAVAGAEPVADAADVADAAGTAGDAPERVEAFFSPEPGEAAPLAPAVTPGAGYTPAVPDTAVTCGPCSFRATCCSRTGWTVCPGEPAAPGAADAAGTEAAGGSMGFTVMPVFLPSRVRTSKVRFLSWAT